MSSKWWVWVKDESEWHHNSIQRCNISSPPNRLQNLSFIKNWKKTIWPFSCLCGDFSPSHTKYRVWKLTSSCGQKPSGIDVNWISQRQAEDRRGYTVRALGFFSDAKICVFFNQIQIGIDRTSQGFICELSYCFNENLLSRSLVMVTCPHWYM